MYKIYSVKDVKSGKFNSINVEVNDDCAIRTFRQVCQKSPIGADLDLYSLGTFNLETGEIISNIEFLCSGANFISEVFKTGGTL